MDLYFQKFPQMYYNNKLCVDITRRTRLSDSTKRNPQFYYNYEVKAGTREDTVANAYYDDPTLSWLIYLTNDIVDPYYQWYNNDDDFIALLKEKYGSYEESTQKIKFFRTNWATDDSQLTPTYFENNLPENFRKYYTPIFGMGTRIVSYQRRPEDVISNTNKIVQFDFDTTLANTFVVGERVIINTLNIPTGSCEVVKANTSCIVGQHVLGNTSSNNTLQGLTSNAEATIATTLLIQSNISDTESNFWEPVYYYDYEREKYEEKKIIKVLDANFAPEASRQLRQQLKE